MLAQQQVARRLAFRRIADQHGNDVGVAQHDRQRRRAQRRLDPSRAVLLALALPLRGLQMPDRRRGRGADRRRQRGGEDEARSIGADRIDQRGASRDIAAEAAEGLGERAFDHVDAVHGAVARGDAGAARAVHADRMDLVEIGHGAVAIGKIADAVDRGDVAAHRIEAFEDDELRPLGARRLQQFLEMSRHRCGGRCASPCRTGGCPRSSNCG